MFHRCGQLVIAREEIVEILFFDGKQFSVAAGADARGARSAAQQSHLAKSLAWAKFCKDARVARIDAFVDHLDHTLGNDVEGVSVVTLAEQDLVCSKIARANARENLFDVFWRKVAQKITTGE